jgi:hypothetical protein
VIFLDSLTEHRSDKRTTSVGVGKSVSSQNKFISTKKPAALQLGHPSNRSNTTGIATRPAAPRESNGNHGVIPKTLSFCFTSGTSSNCEEPRAWFIGETHSLHYEFKEEIEMFGTIDRMAIAAFMPYYLALNGFVRLR